MYAAAALILLGITKSRIVGQKQLSSPSFKGKGVLPNLFCCSLRAPVTSETLAGALPPLVKNSHPADGLSMCNHDWKNRTPAGKQKYEASKGFRVVLWTLAYRWTRASRGPGPLQGQMGKCYVTVSQWWTSAIGPR